MTDRIAEPSTGPLFQSERQQEIVGLAIRHKRVEVAELSDRFGVTTETIRRDLSDLQTQQVLRRVHGGAVPWEGVNFEPLLSVRSDQHDSEKHRLAYRAVQELPQTGSIIIDSGSTLTRFANEIPTTCELQVVTNSMPIAQTLSEHPSLDITVLGGRLRSKTLAMVDGETIASVTPLSVDALFISSDGFSASNGLSTPYRQEAQLKRSMIRAARRVVALIDHSKQGHDHFVRFADWADIDLLITNNETDPDTIAAIKKYGTEVVVA